MLFARRSSSSTAAALRRATTGTRNSTCRRAWQQSYRRGYASTSHQVTEKAKSDLPWIVGAIAVTVPSCWYLLQEGPVKPHDHEPGNDHMEHPEHPEHGETSPEDVGIDEKKADSRMPVEEAIRKPSPDAPKPNTGLAKGAKSEASSESNGESDGESDGEADGKDDGQEDTPETSDDEEQKDGGGDVEGVKGTASRSNEGNTREHIPDAKGYNKKRINSNKAKVAGKAQAEENMPDKGDKAAASKPAGGQSTQSGKQEGLSNTDTKHSTQIEEREDSPKKPEGPETSKAKGTVDPNRPQY